MRRGEGGEEEVEGCKIIGSRENGERKAFSHVCSRMCNFLLILGVYVCVV